jgi:hypothetical protein
MNQFINRKVVIYTITKSLIILGGSMAQKKKRSKCHQGLRFIF